MTPTEQPRRNVAAMLRSARSHADGVQPQDQRPRSARPSTSREQRCATMDERALWRRTHAIERRPEARAANTSSAGGKGPSPPLRPPSCLLPPSWPAKPERAAKLQSPAKANPPGWTRGAFFLAAVVDCVARAMQVGGGAHLVGVRRGECLRVPKHGRWADWGRWGRGGWGRMRH